LLAAIRLYQCAIGESAKSMGGAPSLNSESKSEDGRGKVVRMHVVECLLLRMLLVHATGAIPARHCSHVCV
jgi:hypothetical protein